MKIFSKTALLLVSFFFYSIGDSQTLVPCYQTDSKDKTKKWGFCDSLRTKTIVPCQFDQTFDFRNNMARFVQNGKTGYVNSTGKIAVPATYEMGTDFNSGFAFVKKDGKSFYINKSGVNEFKKYFWFPSMPGFENADESTKKYFSEQMEKQFSEVGFSEGMALFADSALGMGYIDVKGSVRIPPKFIFATKFTEDVAFVAEKPGAGIQGINKKGETLFELPVGHMLKEDGFINGFAVIMKTRQKNNDEVYNYIDKRGNLLLNKGVNYAENFKNGFAVVGINGQRMLINSKGRFAFEEAYNYLAASPIKGIYYYNRKDGGFGLIDTTGKIRTKAGYDYFTKLNDSVFLCKWWGRSVYTLLSIHSGDLFDYSMFTEYSWTLKDKKYLLELFGTDILSHLQTLEYDPLTGKFLKDGKPLSNADNPYLAKKTDDNKKGVLTYENEHFSLWFTEEMELYKDTIDKKTFRNSTFFITINKVDDFRNDAPEYISRMMEILERNGEFESIDYYNVNSSKNKLQYVKAIRKKGTGKEQAVFCYLPVNRQYANPGVDKIYVIYANYFFMHEKTHGAELRSIFDSIKFK